MTDAYMQFLAAVDRMAERIRNQYGTHLLCRSGCHDCCRQHFSLSPVESDAMADAVRALPPDTWQRVHEHAGRAVSLPSSPCPLLIEGKCCVYLARPVICRTQGLPLLLQAEDGVPEVDFCRLNFTAPGATDELEEDFLVDLEALNRTLALVNLDYCRGQGRSLRESGERKLIGLVILDQKGNSE
jgi:uncharacterized protein